ncbi:MAG TPA: hypothetical protein VFJ04_07625 [Rhodanobacteraceae bacterium]|jgi:hypothetical protein|nr:hypothetical protein [Rhodanobacteraceae bacterium]
MDIVNRVIALTRSVCLAREFRDIERATDALPVSARQQLAVLTMREMAQAARCEFPHLYGTAPDQRYLPWSGGTATGIARARSDNPQVCVRGIALWLAIVFHETRESPHAALQERHRQVLGLLRQLKKNIGTGSLHGEPSEWSATAEAAA